jgi:hypothetical protein
MIRSRSFDQQFTNDLDFRRRDHLSNYLIATRAQSSSSHPRCQDSVCRRLALVLLLALAEFGPAGVLLGLSGVGIFGILKPEAEPVHRDTPRRQT